MFDYQNFYHQTETDNLIGKEALSSEQTFIGRESMEGMGPDYFFLKVEILYLDHFSSARVKSSTLKYLYARHNKL